MKGTLSDQALRNSEEFVHALWGQDMEACRPYLDAGFTYIGPSADQYCMTSQGLISYFTNAASEDALRKKVSEEYYQVRAENDASILVTGHVLASYPIAEQQVASHRFRVSLLWSLDGPDLKLIHMHVSTPTWQSRFQTTVPDAISEAGAHQMLSHTHGEAQPLVMRDSSGIAHFLEAREVIYLEAERQYTMVHTEDGVFRLAKVLGKAAAELPPTFLRVHRGFVINVAHVREIHTRSIILDDGTQIPMPERRSVQVRRDVEEAIRSLGSA